MGKVVEAAGRVVIITTRPKSAYARQGLGWDCGAGMQFRWVHGVPSDQIEKVLFCRGPHANKVIFCKVISMLHTKGSHHERKVQFF